MMFLPRYDTASVEEETKYPMRVRQAPLASYVLTSPDGQELSEYESMLGEVEGFVGANEELYVGVDWVSKKNCIILMADPTGPLSRRLQSGESKLQCQRLFSNPYILANEVVEDRATFVTIVERLGGCASDDDRLYLCDDWRRKQNVILWVTAKPVERAICARSKGVWLIPFTGKPSYLMVVDLYRCVGCGACEVACRKEHNLPPGASWTLVEKLGPEKTGDGMAFQPMPAICNHCEDAPCLNVCPTKATYRRDDGIVAVDEDKCIGCRFCMAACPYDMRFFNPERRVVQKCNHCAERLQEGKTPRCVETCHLHARYFGDLEDLKSEIHTVMGKHDSRPLARELRTKPLCQYVLKW